MTTPTTEILISVIIPSRDRNRLLADCLDRLAPGAQEVSSDQYEVIVTDDGVSSTAQEMIQQRYPWVVWIEGPRNGPAANRNNGARFARGAFLVFTDDDCLPERSWLGNFIASLRDDIDVYEGQTVCRAGLGSPMEHAPLNLEGGKLWSCNFMIRKVRFEQIGGFDERFPYAAMEDVALRQKIQALQLNSIFVDDAVVDHPPRRISFLTQQRASHESHIIYWKLFPTERKTLGQYLYYVAKTRVRTILLRRYGWDTLVALASLTCELAIIGKSMGAWERKYGLR